MQNLILPLTLIVTIDTIGDLTNVCFRTLYFSSVRAPSSFPTAPAVAKAWGCTAPSTPWVRGHECVLC